MVFIFTTLFEPFPGRYSPTLNILLVFEKGLMLAVMCEVFCELPLIFIRRMLNLQKTPGFYVGL